MCAAVDLQAESARQKGAAGAAQRPTTEASIRDGLADEDERVSEVSANAVQPVPPEQMDQWLEVLHSAGAQDVTLRGASLAHCPS